MVQCEELTKRYDAMIVCRYPDSMRKYAEQCGFTPWRNEIFKANTKGSINPARFKLVVESNNKKSKNNLEKSKGKYKADRHAVKAALEKEKAEALEKPDDYVDISITISSTEDWAVVGSPEFAKPQLRMKLWPDVDTVNLIRMKRKEEIANIKAKMAEKHRRQMENAKSNIATADTSILLDPDSEKVLSVSKTPPLTATDGIGSEESDHVLSIEASKEAAQSELAEKIAAAEKAKAVALQVLAAEEAVTEEGVRKEQEGKEVKSKTRGPPTDKDLGTVPRTYIPEQKKGVNGRRSVFRSPIEFNYEPRNRLPSDAEIDEETFEYKIRSARSWQSHSFKLLPGTYYIVADVESENTDVVRHGLSLDREGEISERPWAEKLEDVKRDGRERNGTSQIWAQFTSIGNYNVQIVNEETCPANFDNTGLMKVIRSEILALKRDSESLSVQLNQKMKEKKECDAVKDFRVLRSKTHIAKVAELQIDIPRLEGEIDEIDAVIGEKQRIWGLAKREWMNVKHDAWPLMVETQEEVR